MPDDYYVSQYSGEEIDALLGSAGAGTVRYDAAQTLTDAQKAQARNNISAMQGIESTDHPGCNYVLNGSTVEWVNPPMQLGVEYRTTERFLGKPVYVRLINCGSAPSNSLKKFDTGLDYTVIDRRLTPTGNMYASSTDNFSIPCETTNVVSENLNIVHGTYTDSGNVRHDAIFIHTTSTTLTGYTVYVVLKYTKTTD